MHIETWRFVKKRSNGSDFNLLVVDETQRIYEIEIL